MKKGRNELLNELEYHLTNIANRVALSKSRHNTNITFENTIKGVLNIAYGYNLTNSNIHNPNNKATDLEDIENKVAYQITSQNKTTKLKETVTGFIDANKSEAFKKFIILSLTTGSNKCSDKSLEKLKEYDVIASYENLSDLENYIVNEASTGQLLNIVKYLDFEFNTKLTPAKIEVGLKSQYSEYNIVEQMFKVLLSFDGMYTIHPRAIARLWPFNSGRNIGDFSAYTLSIDNNDIFELFQEIIIEKDVISITNKDFKGYEEKIFNIIQILNKCLIFHVIHTDSSKYPNSVNISLTKTLSICDCNRCLYRRNDFETLISKLKGRTSKFSENYQEEFSDAYFLNKIDLPVESWRKYENIVNNNECEVLTFMAMVNSKNLYSSLSHYKWENEAREILPLIDKIDPIEYLADTQLAKPVKYELLRIYKSEYIYHSREKIIELLNNIRERKAANQKGYNYFIGPNYLRMLYEEAHIIWHYYERNLLSNRDYNSFAKVILNVIEAFFINFSGTNNASNRSNELPKLLVWFILEKVDYRDLGKLLKKYNITELKIQGDYKSNMIEIATNLLTSQFYISTFGKSQIKPNYEGLGFFSKFRYQLNDLFNSIMLLLGYSIYCSSDLANFNKQLLYFINASNELDSINWDHLIIFIDKKYEGWNEDMFVQLLEIGLSQRNHRCGEGSIKDICKVMAHKAAIIIKNKSIIEKLFTKAIKDCDNCNRMHDESLPAYFWLIFNEFGKKKIQNYYLDKLRIKFNGSLYEDLALIGVFTIRDNQKLFDLYVDFVSKCCSKHDIKIDKGRWFYRSLYGINGLRCLDHLGADFNSTVIRDVGQKSEFYKWAIDIGGYNYEKFNVQWLIDLGTHPYFRNKFKGIKSLRTKVENQLNIKFDEKLSNFYVKNILSVKLDSGLVKLK